MTRYSLRADLDFHTTAVSTIDSKIRGLGNDNDLRTDFVLLDDVLPAKSITIFFLNASNDIECVLVL